jgi:hypothetical protein
MIQDNVLRIQYADRVEDFDATEHDCYVVFSCGNEYFDTYYLYGEGCKKIGIIEDHCRGVKSRYFVGWKLHKPNGVTGETKCFDSKGDAIKYSLGELAS